jgi:hypothetical protein
MAKKCKCGRKAHVCINGQFYCLECKPNPEKMKRPKEWPDPVEVYDVEFRKIEPEPEPEKKWWQFWK